MIDDAGGPPAAALAAAEIDWAAVWQGVAARMSVHRAAGRAHLVTEDSVRMETVLALEQAGVAAARLRSEVLAPELTGGKLDLVVDPPDGAVIELKYPRSSRTGVSPDTMTFGELVRDFLRVAVVPARSRWVVQLVEDRLARYITGICRRHMLTWASSPGERLILPAEAVAGLPDTAGRSIGLIAATAGTVTATCSVTAPVGDGLTLFAYAVDPAAVQSGSTIVQPSASEPPETSPAPDEPALAAQRATRDGARREILAAVGAIVARSGRNAFAITDVITEMRSRGTGYAESTIRTMISAHLCADASGHGIAGYSDLVRVGRGLYGLAGQPRGTT